MNPPTAGKSNVMTRPTEHQQGVVVAVRLADGAQRREVAPIAVVRRCARENDIRRPSGKRGEGGTPFAVAGDAVHFIDDDQIPATGNCGRQHLGALEVVHRDDRDRDGLPRIHAQRKRRGSPPQRAHIENGRQDPEAFRQFMRPLIAQAGRRHDEHSIRRAAALEFGNDQPCLNRLSQTDIVRKQDTRPESANDGECRFELVRQQIDSGFARGGQRARGCLCREQKPTGAAPQASRRTHRPLAALNPFCFVEWQDEAASGADVVRVRAGHEQNVTVLVARYVENPPPRTTHANNLGLRNPHRCSVVSSAVPETAGRAMSRKSVIPTNVADGVLGGWQRECQSGDRGAEAGCGIVPEFDDLYVWSSNASQGDPASGRRRGQPELRVQPFRHGGRRDHFAADRAQHGRAIPVLARRRRPVDRRRVLSRLVHERRLGEGRSARQSEIQRDVRHQPEHPRRERLANRQQDGHAVVRAAVAADDGRVRFVRDVRRL